MRRSVTTDDVHLNVPDAGREERPRTRCASRYVALWVGGFARFPSARHLVPLRVVANRSSHFDTNSAPCESRSLRTPDGVLSEASMIVTSRVRSRTRSCAGNLEIASDLTSSQAESIRGRRESRRPVRLLYLMSREDVSSRTDRTREDREGR